MGARAVRPLEGVQRQMTAAAACACEPGKKCRGCQLRELQRANASSPAVAAKRSATMRQLYQDPNYRSAHRAAVRRGIRAALQDPAKLERRRANGRRDMRPPPAGHPARIAAGRSRSATLLAWCPEAWRDCYRRLMKRKGAAEARPIVEEAIALDRAEFLRTGRWQTAERIAELVSTDRLPWCRLDLRPQYRQLSKTLGAAEARRIIEEEMEKRPMKAATAPAERPDYVPAVCGLCDRLRTDPATRACVRIGCPLQPDRNWK